MSGYWVSSEVFLALIFVLIGVSLLVVAWVVFMSRFGVRSPSLEPAGESWFYAENERLERVVAGELLWIEQLCGELEEAVESGRMAAFDVESLASEARVSSLWSEYSGTGGRGSGGAATHGDLIKVLGEARASRSRLEAVMTGLGEEGS